MIFYQIQLHTVPKIDFACSVDIEHYKNDFHDRRNFIEISVIERGEIIYRHDCGRSDRLTRGTLASVFDDAAFHSYATGGLRSAHSTVGVTANYDRVKRDTASASDCVAAKSALKKAGTFFIPAVADTADDFSEIRNQIRRIGTLFSSPKSSAVSDATAQWFSLVALLTDFVLQKIDNSHVAAPSDAQYVALAEQLIAARLQSGFSVADIASAVGLSEGYLQLLFKRVNGIGITDYANTLRISLAKQYIKSSRLPLCRIASLVGVEDPAYMSRLFKKITGIGYRDYLRRHTDESF